MNVNTSLFVVNTEFSGRCIFFDDEIVGFLPVDSGTFFYVQILFFCPFRSNGLSVTDEDISCEIVTSRVETGTKLCTIVSLDKKTSVTESPILCAVTKR